MEDHHLQRLEIHFKRQMLKEEVERCNAAAVDV